MTTPTVSDIIQATEKLEGGYVNNPSDKGGPTNYGITQATARANGYTGDMKNLPLATATAIYKAEYWDVQNFDSVYALTPHLAAKMFDTGVNCGVGTAVMLLQRALNVLFGSGLAKDGVMKIGGATLTALQKFYNARPNKAEEEGVLMELYTCFQGERYAELVENDPTQRTFIYGWTLNRLEGIF